MKLSVDGAGHRKLIPANEDDKGMFAGDSGKSPSAKSKSGQRSDLVSGRNRLDLIERIEKRYEIRILRLMFRNRYGYRMIMLEDAGSRSVIPVGERRVRFAKGS